MARLRLALQGARLSPARAESPPPRFHVAQALVNHRSAAGTLVVDPHQFPPPHFLSSAPALHFGGQGLA